MSDPLEGIPAEGKMSLPAPFQPGLLPCHAVNRVMLLGVVMCCPIKCS